MRILLLGATGRTGKWVLKLAIEEGYKLNCLSRNSSRIPLHENISIFDGNPLNKIDLEKAITGCDYVINVLNISRKSDFPWSKLRTPKTYLSEVMKVLVPMSTKHHIKRLLVCSAWGVSETRNDIPFWFRWLIDNSNIGKAYEDHERQEAIVSKSSLDWTIIRPVGLINSAKDQSIKVSYNNFPKPSLLITRKSVASFMVRMLKKNEFIKEIVVPSNR